MQQTLSKLPKPRNQMSHLLYDMIKGKMIAEQDFPYNRFRGSLSDLRNIYDLPVFHIDEPFTNSFGRQGKFRRHFIIAENREQAIEIYNKINL